MLCCAVLQAYHTAADRLQLIPVTAKYAGSLQYEVQLNRAGTSASDIIAVDLKVPPAGGCLAMVLCTNCKSQHATFMSRTHGPSLTM